MAELEQDVHESSGTLTLGREEVELLTDIGIIHGRVPANLLDELPRGLDLSEVESIRSQVTENVKFHNPKGRRSERLARKISQNTLRTLGESALKNKDYVSSGSIIQVLDPGLRIWRVGALYTKLLLQKRQVRAMAGN